MVKADEATAPAKVSSVLLPPVAACLCQSLAPSSPSRAPPSSSPVSSKVALSLDTHVKVDQLGLQFGRCQRSSATMLLPQAPAAITLYRSLHKQNCSVNVRIISGHHFTGSIIEHDNNLSNIKSYEGNSLTKFARSPCGNSSDALTVHQIYAARAEPRVLPECLWYVEMGITSKQLMLL